MLLLILLNSRGNDLPPIYAGWLRFNLSFLVLFTDTERCQCNEVIWKAVTGVFISINILLVAVIVWQHKIGDIKFFPFYVLLIFHNFGT